MGGFFCKVLMMDAEIFSEQSEIFISIILKRTICEKHGKSKRGSTSNTLSYGLYYRHTCVWFPNIFMSLLKLKLGLSKIWRMSLLNSYLRCTMMTSECCVQLLCHCDYNRTVWDFFLVQTLKPQVKLSWCNSPFSAPGNHCNSMGLFFVI